MGTTAPATTSKKGTGLFKGAVAAAAGTALLLGGAGTFALWNHTADIGTEGEIQSGHLRFADSAPTGDWTLNGSPISLDSLKMSPGDVLTYTADVDVEAQGSHLSAELGWEGGPNVTAASEATADTDFATRLTSALTVTGDGITPGDGENVFTFDADEAGTTRTITVEIDFTFATTTGAQEAQDASVTVDDVTLTLDQALDTNGN